MIIVATRFLVVDGTFVTANGLQLTKPNDVARVHAVMGFMRDDGAAFISTPVSCRLILLCVLLNVAHSRQMATSPKNSKLMA